ncbi:MAG: aminopeptidase [Bacteroidetes bacterium]|nr:aminopeptidase [Bacteroidota bacterium]
MSIRTLLLSLSGLLVLPAWLFSQNIGDLLMKTQRLDSIKQFAVTNNAYTAYVMYFEQPVDHKKPNGLKFLQRVVLRHRGFDRPVVMVTEGYGAAYALWDKYDEELANALNANLIVVEHRFFGKSVPDNKPWNQLNLYNATADLHAVNILFKQFYKGPWVSTGISKGGQTTLYYRYFYPDDVHASVPYVAPLNFSDKEKRFFHFQDTVNTPACRERLLALQRDLLQRREIFFPMFVDSTKALDLTFNMVGSIEKAYEYNVLEFGFAYWQWYPMACDSLPEAGGDPAGIFNAFISAAGYDFFADQSIMGFQPFFYQALTEMGMYTYDTDEFKGMLHEVSKPGFTHTLPDGVKVKYDGRLNKKVDKFLKTKANNMLFIYGGFDAWSSSAFIPGRATNVVKMVKPGGSHATRISSFSSAEQEKAYQLVKSWLHID